MATVARVLCFLVILSAVLADKVDQGTQTDPHKFVDVSKLSVIDIIRAGVFGFAILACFLSDKRGEVKKLQTIDAYVFMLEGFCGYFFPKEFLSLMTDQKISTQHVYMVQILGVTEIGIGVVTYLQTKSNSQDSLVQFSWLLSRFLGITLASMVMLFPHYTSSIFNNTFVASVVISLAICVLGSMYKLVTYVHKDGGRKVGGSSLVRTSILITTLLMFHKAVGFLALPEFVIKKFLDGSGYTSPDDLILVLMRTVGAFFFMQLFQLVFSLQYKNDDDRRAFFAGRLVSLMLGIPMVLLYQWKDPVHQPDSLIYILFSGIADLFVAMGGYHGYDFSCGICPLFKK